MNSLGGGECVDTWQHSRVIRVQIKETEMSFLTQLYLPILLSGVGVWIASAVCWMAIGHHKKDRDAIPAGREQEFMDSITKLGIGPGNYGFPDFCQYDNLPRKERMEKLKALYDRRPYGILRVWGEMNMGVNMFLTFLFFLVTSAIIAYLGWAVMPAGHRVCQSLSGGWDRRYSGVLLCDLSQRCVVSD